MIVVYYTQTYYLDAVIETIQSIKNMVELHVLIELSPESKQSTIIDIGSLNDFETIEDCDKVLGWRKWALLKKYFEGVASIRFVVHQHKKAFSLTSLSTAAKAGKYIQLLNADIIHFDTVSGRSIGMYPYIRSKRIMVTVHDPMPHSGEGSWKKKVPEWIYYPRAKGFFFYSNFAQDQFKKYHGRYKAASAVLRFQPFTYIQQFKRDESTDEKVILFFGRISKYKGIDLLLKAIPAVLQKFPDEKFIIAGASSYGYKVDEKIIGQFSKNIRLIEGTISVSDLMMLLSKAKFVICPYRDATQSGVLMTALAAGKMAIATNIGAFPEYIEQDQTGMLTSPDAAGIEATIIRAIKNDHYKTIEQKLNSKYDNVTGNKNAEVLLAAYQENIHGYNNTALQTVFD